MSQVNPERITGILNAAAEQALSESLTETRVVSEPSLFSTALALKVKKSEESALLKQLEQYGNRRLSLGLAAGNAVMVGQDAPLLVQLLAALSNSRGSVGEMIFSGRLEPDYRGRLKREGGGGLFQPAQLKRSVVTLNDQPSIPLIITGPVLPELNSQFSAFTRNINDEIMSDPLMVDYIERLRVVSAIHYADLVKTQPELLLDITGEALKNALLARLQRFGDAYEQILRKQGMGWVIDGTVARAYLEMRIAEAVSQAA